MWWSFCAFSYYTCRRWTGQNWRSITKLSRSIAWVIFFTTRLVWSLLKRTCCKEQVARLESVCCLWEGIAKLDFCEVFVHKYWTGSCLLYSFSFVSLWHCTISHYGATLAQLVFFRSMSRSYKRSGWCSKFVCLVRIFACGLRNIVLVVLNGTPPSVLCQWEWSTSR